MTKVPRYAQVIVDIAHADVDRVFTYAIPDGMALQVGMRVAVPFGRQEKEGYVLGFSDDCELPPDRIRQVKEPLEDYPAILPGLVELARGMSVSAHCPLAETLRLMIPAQMRGGRIGVKTEKAARLLLSGEALQAARAAQAQATQPRKVKPTWNRWISVNPASARIASSWSGASRCRCRSMAARPASACAGLMPDATAKAA